MVMRYSKEVREKTGVREFKAVGHNDQITASVVTVQNGNAHAPSPQTGTLSGVALATDQAKD